MQQAVAEAEIAQWGLGALHTARDLDGADSKLDAGVLATWNFEAMRDVWGSLA